VRCFHAKPVLSPKAHGSSKVGVVGQALEQQVNVIRHHAEGNNSELHRLEDLLNLIS